MQRLFALQAVAAVILLFLVAVYGSHFLERHVGARLKLGGAASVGIKAETRRYLEGLHGHVSLTYFVTARTAMPSSMKGVEDAMHTLLQVFKDAAPDRIDFRVLDPDLQPKKGPTYASGKGASPVKVRKILADESSEEAVWSSLVISHDQYPDALIQGIGPADVAYLEDLVVENLKVAERPIQPVIAVSSPPQGFVRVREFMKAFAGARVIDVDLDHDPRIPIEADVLFWIEPKSATRAHAEAIERFLRTGRSAIIAGSTHAVEYVERQAGRTAYRIQPSPCNWKALLQPFGLSLAPVLVTDKNHDAISMHFGGVMRQVDAPFHLRILPSFYDTKLLLGPPTGALLVSATSPIQWDPQTVASKGRRVEVVATTSENARILDLPTEEFDDAFLEGARAVPKQPWMAILKPQDPWQGDLLVVGSSLLFHDAPYAQGGNANQVFLRTLLRTFTQSPRLARSRVPRLEPERMPPLSLASRLAWRGIVVGFMPATLMVLALRSPRGRWGGLLELRWPRTTLANATAFLCLTLLLEAWLDGWAPRVDLTADWINTPSLVTMRLLDCCRDGLEVEYFVSDETRLPSTLRQLERRVISALHSLGIRPQLVRPEDLSAEEQGNLKAAGIEPFDVEAIESDALVTARVWGAIRLRRGGRTETIPQIDLRAAEHLEFLMAAAAKRLVDGPAPLVGILSDLPRLSPAEAHLDYQQKGYTAPVGSDIYSFVKKLLSQHGYRVAYINPEAPVFPEGMEVLVWLQPRYPWKVIGPFAKFMAAGGKAVVAVQHYNIQQRQYRGAGFQTVYWPQPQFHGFNDYLAFVGVRQIGDKRGEQSGEILFDRNHAALVLDTQVNRSAFREHNPQQVSRPFLIQAAGDALNARSVITSRLGDLLFVWGSRLSLDEGKLAKLGIHSEVLVTTSPRTWTYAWSGGWIPEESFAEPTNSFLGPQPLAVLLEGSFPWLTVERGSDGRDALKLDGAPGSPHRPGQLVLIGCSEMFKNGHLFAPTYQHDQFLLNAVAFLAYGDDLASVEARRRMPKSFAFQPPPVKLAWRTIAIGLSPVLFVVYGLAHGWLRRRTIV